MSEAYLGTEAFHHIGFAAKQKISYIMILYTNLSDSHFEKVFLMFFKMESPI